jgi:hypothetical protein
MITVTTYPLHLVEGDVFTFTYEGVTRVARANWEHVFYEEAPLSEHLRLASIGLYDGLTLTDADGRFPS